MICAYPLPRHRKRAVQSLERDSDGHYYTVSQIYDMKKSPKGGFRGIFKCRGLQIPPVPPLLKGGNISIINDTVHYYMDTKGKSKDS